MWIATLDSSYGSTSELDPVNDVLFSAPPTLMDARGTTIGASPTENGVTC